MKTIKYILLICAIAITATSIRAEGIEFFHGTWAEALQKAFDEEKVIFVDAYTTWCGPCKRMAATTFKDATVGEYFNTNFINVKLDMEKAEGLAWRNTYPVTAYPTLYFINGDGDVVLKSVGGKKVDDLLKMANSANKNNDRSAKYAEEYDAGKRDFTLVYKYVKALNKANKSSLKISNEYLDSEPQITEEQRREFLLEAATETDSKIFDHMIAEKSDIEKQFSKEIVEEKIMLAAERTAKKAITYEAPSLIESATGIVKAHTSMDAQKFENKAKMDYALYMRDDKMYADEIKDFSKKIEKDDDKGYYKIATEINEYFPENKNLMKLAEESAKKAFEAKNLYIYLVSYTDLLIKNGKVDDAIKIVDQRIAKAEKEDKEDVTKQLEKLKKKISQI